MIMSQIKLVQYIALLPQFGAASLSASSPGGFGAGLFDQVSWGSSWDRTYCATATLFHNIYI